MTKQNEYPESFHHFITIGPETYYQEACVRKRLCERTQFLVVAFDKWLKWYDSGLANNPDLPKPVFVGDSLEIVMKVADELNAGIQV